MAEVDASREHAVTEWIAEARGSLSRGDTMGVAALIDRVNSAEPDHPAAASLARDLRLLKADQEHARRRATTFATAISAAEAALAVNDLDEALARAREALAIDPSSQRALALQEEALQSPQQAQTARPTADTPTASARAEARALRPEVRREEAQAGPRRLLHKYRWAITAAAGLILLAAVIGAYMSRGQAVPVPSLAVLDAAPWATILSVQREGGDAVVLPEDASTPLALRLNPGDYRVVLQGPPPQLEQRTISVRVEPGVAATLPAQKFDTISVEEYFRRYLLPAAPVVEPAAPVEGVSP